MKNANSKGYIGCCCSAFYSKHRHELEEAGVPGILVDLDDQTCYDLGKAQDAYDGNFEAQTQLKTELLSKLLNRLGTKRIVHEVVERCGTSMS
jgi:lipoate-protein ligase A